MSLIRGISVDLDGCFLGVSFLKNAKKDVIAANYELLHRIRDDNGTYKHTRIFVGSNRQSVLDDKGNAGSNKNGSGFPYVLKIADYLEASVDKFLLASLYNDLQDNEAFDQALKYLNKDRFDYNDEKCRGINFPEWLHDKSKLTILYAQIHRLAAENPYDEIEFYFYEDRTDILDNLHAYFLRYPQLLPRNVRLQLIRYEGPVDINDKKIEPLIVNYPLISGAGKIDIEFKRTVKDMAATSIASKSFQASDPSDRYGKPIKNYEDAKANGFMMTNSLNCTRDYQPVAVERMLKVIAIKEKENSPLLLSDHRNTFFDKIKSQSEKTLPSLSPGDHKMKKTESEPDMIICNYLSATRNTAPAPAPVPLSLLTTSAVFWPSTPRPQQFLSIPETLQERMLFQLGTHRTDV